MTSRAAHRDFRGEQAPCLRTSVLGDLGRGNRAGVTLNYEYTNYSFSNPVRFGNVAPWNIVQRYGVSVPLSFGLSDGWSVGLGAAWRNARFHLSKNGPLPNGIGEERGVPVSLRATHAYGEQISLSLYAGLVTAGELRVENSSGNELSQVDSDTAPFFGARSPHVSES